MGNTSTPASVALWAVSYMDGAMRPLLTLPLGVTSHQSYQEMGNLRLKKKESNKKQHLPDSTSTWSMF